MTEPLSPAPALDEAAARRATFDPDNSVAVVMADGTTWHLRRPRVASYYPVVRGGKVLDIGCTSDLGPAFDEARGRAEAAAGGKVAYQDYFVVAWEMLRPNYDLPDDAARLFAVRPHDPATDATFQAVMAVALGLAPAPAAAAEGGV